MGCCYSQEEYVELEWPNKGLPEEERLSRLRADLKQIQEVCKEYTIVTPQVSVGFRAGQKFINMEPKNAASIIIEVPVKHLREFRKWYYAKNIVTNRGNLVFVQPYPAYVLVRDSSHIYPRRR